MNIRFLAYSYLILSSHAFVSNPLIYKQFRKIKLTYHMYVKKNENVFLPIKTSVVQNIACIMKDDISNDLLYFMKFYHLSQDNVINYFYIVFYELLSLSIRNEENTILQLRISLINIMLYILVKNVIINHYLHHYGQ